MKAHYILIMTVVVCGIGCSSSQNNSNRNSSTETIYSPMGGPAPMYEGVILAKKYRNYNGPLFYTIGPHGKPDYLVLRNAVEYFEPKAHITLRKNIDELRKGDVVRVWTDGHLMMSIPGQIVPLRIELVARY